MSPESREIYDRLMADGYTVLMVYSQVPVEPVSIDGYVVHVESMYRIYYFAKKPYSEMKQEVEKLHDTHL